MKQGSVKSKWGIRAHLLRLYDAIAINMACFMALMIRFDFRFGDIPQRYMNGYLRFAVLNTILCIFIFYITKMYQSLWIYASITETWNAFVGCFVTILVNFAINVVANNRMPRSYYLLAFIFLYMAVLAARFFYRFLRFVKRERAGARKAIKDGKNVMVVGAGSAGKMIANEIDINPELRYRLVCFVDDMKSKQGRMIDGVPVLGGTPDIEELANVHGIDIIMLAIPSASEKKCRELLNICQKTGCEVRSLGNVHQLLNDAVTLDQMHKIDITDLLGRDQIAIDQSQINGYLEGKVVLVTGGGGSIGSELCRQIANNHPKTLIIVDIYENNAYDIQQELLKIHPELDLKVLIGSVRNTHRITSIFEQYKPEIVYHAAAHKHVPLMEDSPNEAIKNNVFGTYKTAMAAAQNGTKRFVLISTDKAVNPTNIMGASKRLCEMIVQMMNRKYETEFVAVRFGNVLGSNGSVVPLFRKQIEAGGPVTVTHKDIVRYFMTIPEAVALVLQAGANAKGGEIFVLDMGEPVRIDDLARNMIRLSGYTPDIDMKIVYTGLRPGEKLYEELLMAEEGLVATDNELIYIGEPISMDDTVFEQQLMDLKAACEQDDHAIKYAVSQIVRTYRCPCEEKAG